MYSWMYRWCESHHIPFYGLHAFRHFAATQMIGSDIDVRTVSAVLGHSKPSTTLNIYSHEIDQLKTTAVDVIAGAIQNKKDQNCKQQKRKHRKLSVNTDFFGALFWEALTKKIPDHKIKLQLYYFNFAFSEKRKRPLAKLTRSEFRSHS